jgi:putative hydrolase of the HAD superfamily
MYRLAAVLFDLDDTLLDRRGSVERYLAAHAMRATLDAELAIAYQSRFWALDDNGHTTRTDLFAQLGAEFPTIGSPQDLLADFVEHGFATCEWIDGAEAALAWCRTSGLRTGIITNGSSGMQRAKLRARGLSERVDTILVSEEEGVSKPSSQIFHRAAERLRVRPDQCVFVGDNPIADVDGARRAGMLDVWIQREFPWPPGLAVATHSITALASLPDLLAI